MTTEVLAFFDSATSTVSYIVFDPATGDAAIIDPVLDFDPRRGRLATKSAQTLLEAVADRRLTPRWILETHAHADHLSAGDWLRGATGAPIVIGAGIVGVQAVFAPLFGATGDALEGRAFNRLVRDGDTLALGGLTIQVIETPGHTPACVSYRIGDAVFVGDTLFMPDVGTARCDFPGGDAAVLYASIRRLLDLPGDTRVFTAHDYLTPERHTHTWKSTVADQRAGNIHIRDGVSETEFVAMRTARDQTLDAPVLILPALQVNIRAGALPPPDPDGRVRLKLPIDAL